MTRIILIILLFSPAICAATPKLRVAFDWYINPIHAPLLLADKTGLLKPMQLEVIIPQDPNLGLKMLALKQIDLAVTDLQTLLQHQQKNHDLQAVAVLIDQPLDCVIMRVDSQHQHLSDLRHAKIAVASRHSRHADLRKILATAGISIPQVELIWVKYNLLQALLTEQVQAISGVYRNDELVFLQQKRVPVLPFYPEQFGVPKHDSVLIVANAKTWSGSQQRKLIEALTASVDTLKADPAVAWQQWIAWYPQFNTSTQKSIWYATIPLLAHHPDRIHVAENQRYQQFLNNIK